MDNKKDKKPIRRAPRAGVLITPTSEERLCFSDIISALGFCKEIWAYQSSPLVLQVGHDYGNQQQMFCFRSLSGQGFSRIQSDSGTSCLQSSVRRVVLDHHAEKRTQGRRALTVPVLLCDRGHDIRLQQMALSGKQAQLRHCRQNEPGPLVTWIGKTKRTRLLHADRCGLFVFLFLLFASLRLLCCLRSSTRYLFDSTGLGCDGDDAKRCSRIRWRGQQMLKSERTRHGQRSNQRKESSVL